MTVMFQTSINAITFALVLFLVGNALEEQTQLLQHVQKSAGMELRLDQSSVMTDQQPLLTDAVIFVSLNPVGHAQDLPLFVLLSAAMVRKLPLKFVMTVTMIQLQNVKQIVQEIQLDGPAQEDLPLPPQLVLKSVGTE